MKQKKNIVILSTGGTIAGSGKQGEANEYRAGSLPVSSILETIPQAASLAELSVTEICSVDSNDISFNHYAAIQNHVKQLDLNPDVDGIVITHGTDTLEESAFLLNLILDTRKPVVLTGAMRPATAASADGPMNLYQAIALACCREAGDMGVLAVFSNTIYAGRDLEKTNSIKTDAFKSSEFGTLGYMRDDQVYLIHAPYKDHTWKSEFAGTDVTDLPQVEICYIHQGSDPNLLKHMLDHYDGLILACTGSGNYPAAIQEVIKTHPTTCAIVRSSRLSEGAVFDSAVFDPDKNTIPALKLSPHKSRLLLMLALSKTQNKKEIERIFEQY